MPSPKRVIRVLASHCGLYGVLLRPTLKTFTLTAESKQNKESPVSRKMSQSVLLMAKIINWNLPAVRLEVHDGGLGQRVVR
jgi:hypothetical protein